MKRFVTSTLLAASAALLLSGCIGKLFNVDLFIVGEQTALEKQVLGSYSALGQDLTMYSSVRGVDDEGRIKVPPPSTDSQKAAFAAMRNREYNRDDLDLILIAGVYGEGADGLLAPRDGNPAKVEGISAEEVDTISREENRDRSVILDRLVTTTPNVTPEQKEDVAWIMAGLNQDLAPAGSWVQDRKGGWRQK